MKKLVIAALLLLVSAYVAAQGVVPTANLGLGQIPTGYANWGPVYNAAMVTLDTTVGSLLSHYQGDWASGSTYSKGQEVTVTSGGAVSVYVSLQNNNHANTPASSPVSWKLFFTALGTAGTAAHANNLPADFATQSVGTPATGTFTRVTLTDVSCSGSTSYVKGNGSGCGIPAGGGTSGISALTGDVLAGGTGSVSASLATVNGGAGACGDATHSCALVTDGKGRVLSQSQADIEDDIARTTANSALSTANGAQTLATQAEADAQSSLAQVAASTSSASIVVTATQSSNGSTSISTNPKRKTLGNCETGYAGGALVPGAGNGGDFYCTSAMQTDAVANGGPTLGFVNLTTSGTGSTVFANGNGAGGTHSPTAVTTTWGGSSSDSFCTSDPSAAVATGVPGLTLPGCVPNGSEFFSQTTGSNGNVDTLAPTAWSVPKGDNADRLIRELWFRVNNSATLQNFEFDTNYHASTNDYYGWGFQYNNQVGTKMFQVCPQTCSPWQTIKLVDPTGINPTLTTYTLTQSHVYHVRIYMHRGSVATCTDLSSLGCASYDKMYLQDVTAGTPGVLYNIQYLSNSTYTLRLQPGAARTTYTTTAGQAPSFLPVSLPTWSKNQLTLQVQLDMNTSNSTTSVDINSDTITAYQMITGSGTTPASTSGTPIETAGDLGEWDFDGLDAVALTNTGSPTTSSASYTFPTAMHYSTASQYSQVPVRTTSTLYARFYIQLNTITGVSNRIFSLLHGTGEVGNIYVDGNSQRLTFNNNAASTQTACGVALDTVDYHLVELFWHQDASAGAYTVMLDGATACAFTGLNTGTSQVDGVRFGIVNAAADPFDFYIDNVGLDDTNWMGAITFASPLPTAVYQTNLSCSVTGSGTTQVITCPGLLNIMGGFQLNGVNVSMPAATQAVTITGSSNLGTGGTAVCDTADGFTCDSKQGVVTLVTGSASVANGDYFTVSWANSIGHVAAANFSNVYWAAGTGVLTIGNVQTDVTASSSTQMTMRYTSTAPGTSITFKIRYHID